ncbi:2'-5' RNA ligase family protein [Clostridium sp. UBA1056]|uniref:2'-5' RNA ligase family protein n=1 Tax=unclassified Clostridium TaxID=2614128 RepID=UPI0032170803
MRYAVELYFDKNTEEEILKLAQGIANAGISKKYLEWRTRPHITIAIFNDIDIEKCDKILKEIVKDTRTFPALLSSIGVFNNTRTVYLAPVVCDELINLHKRVHKAFDFCDLNGWEYYTAGQWVPHCAIMLGSEDEESALVEATRYVIENYKVFENSRYEEIGFVEIAMPVKELEVHKLCFV